MAKTHVLLALDRRDDAINSQIVEVLDREKHIQIDRVYSRAKALERFESHRHPDFLVTTADLAPDPTHGIAANGGLTLCEELHERKSKTRTAIVVPAVTIPFQEWGREIEPRPLFCIDREIDTKLASYIRKLEIPGKCLEILILTREAGDWDYRLIGENFDVPFKYDGTLRLGQALPSTWETISNPIMGSTPTKSWLALFQTLGQNLIQGMLEHNSIFASRLDQGLELAGGLGKSRVTFFVGEGRYQIALESIFAPQFERDEAQPSADRSSKRVVKPFAPWIIQAPLFRTLATDGTIPSCKLRTAVPLRTLILCADTHGTVNNMKLKPLKHIHGECNVLRMALSKAGSAHSDAIKAAKELKPEFDDHEASSAVGFLKIEEPKTMGGGSDVPLTRQSLIEILSSETWHVVHFAGHSFFKPGTGDEPAKGYIVVGAPGEPEAVEISDIAPYLRKCKLLYLSSCQSANAGFVAQAADSGIPAVVGFRTLIPDESAKLYATTFYSHLLTNHSIDTAFLEARRRMYQRQEDGTWASAMLVMGRGKL